MKAPAGPHSRRGAAVVSALLILMVLSGLVLAYLAVAVNSKRMTAHRTEEFRVETTANAAIRMAVNNLWGGFEFANRDARVRPQDFMNFLDGRGIVDSAGGAPAPTELRAGLGLPSDGGVDLIGSVAVDSVEVVREDLPEGTRLTFTARVTDRQVQGAVAVDRDVLDEVAQQVYLVERSRFQGLDFAMLSNNLNCAFCHLNVDNVDRAYNNDASMFGTFDRVKVGSLETFQSRHGTSDSRIAGTLYLSGQAVYDDATTINDWSTLDLKGFGFDGNDRILEDLSGTLTLDDLRPADALAPVAGENLYLEYGADTSLLVDGFLPSEFPAVFPDDGGIDPGTGLPLGAGAGNRIVDPEEFAVATADVTGSLSGGRIYEVGAGDTIDNASEVSDMLTSSTTATLASTTIGNVFLEGTEANPILLNGDIAIDGDVIITGFVKGEGVIRSSGNIYLPSDLQYVDGDDVGGNRTFGQAADGTQNGLALAAGGNILVGDVFLKGAIQTTSVPTSGGFGFVWQEVSNFNKLEWIKSQPNLPAYGEDVYDPSTFTAPNPFYEGPSYLPRYYTYDEEVSLVPILIGDGYFDPVSNLWIGPERATSWGSFSLVEADPSDPTDPFLYGPGGAPKAAISPLMPKDDWIDEANYKDLMDQITTRRDGSTALEVDAVLYTANSIFGLTGSRNASFNGEFRINGAVVAADIGLLAGRGLEINYDERAAGLLDIVYDSELSIRHVLSTTAVMQ